MRRKFSVLVENNPGVLTRVTGLFSRRGYNIDSLAVGRTEDLTISRITIVVEGEATVLDQVAKQLRKLVDVIRIQDITDEPHVDRELILIKVKADSTIRGEVVQIVEIFRGRIVDVGEQVCIVEVTGDEGKIAAIERALKPFGIMEVVRTGKVAMQRGIQTVLTED